MKKLKTSKSTLPAETVLVMRTCTADLKSYGGFQWKASGIVTASDWNPRAECGNGLHGFLWGVGDGSLADWASDAKWLVCRVNKDGIVDLGGKVKFESCEVVFVGDSKTAPEYVSLNGGAGKAIVSGTATAGYRGTATAGYRGTATAGDRGTATAGDSGTATAGVSGTATAGPGGVIAILHWNGKRYKAKIAHVKDEDGDGELEPNTPYRLNADGEFEKAVI